LFLSSIIALDADTGAYVWHYQATPGEEWDYDAVQDLVLAELSIDGTKRQVLMQANKNGFFYVLDRKTGQLISANNFVPVTWASGIDLKTGRPIENPDSRYERPGCQPRSTSRPGVGLSTHRARSISSTSSATRRTFVWASISDRVGRRGRSQTSSRTRPSSTSLWARVISSWTRCMDATAASAVLSWSPCRPRPLRADRLRTPGYATLQKMPTPARSGAGC
jgi:hypothetical protein